MRKAAITDSRRPLSREGRYFETAAGPFGLEILAPAEAVRRLENR
jgi:hypothetical protein